MTLKIDFENQILALFDGYFWPFNKSHEKIKSIFVITAIIPSIWNVFIKFRWRDEILTSDNCVSKSLNKKSHLLAPYKENFCNKTINSEKLIPWLSRNSPPWQDQMIPMKWQKSDRQTEQISELRLQDFSTLTLKPHFLNQSIIF